MQLFSISYYMLLLLCFLLYLRMAPSGQLTVRVRSKDGMKRIEIGRLDSLDKLLQKVRSEFQLSPGGWRLCHESQRNVPLQATRKSVNDFNIKNGDMLYLDIESEPGTSKQSSVNSAQISDDVSEAKKKVVPSVDLDEVDLFLQKEDGKIYRERDERQCLHGPLTKCVHCFPVDPWDEEYLTKKDIRHMSFNAYLRKINSVHGRSSQMFLENISCKIKPGCKSHPQWPAGICSNCKPSNVVLNRQRFRHVDNVSFENQFLVNRFLDYWRKSGSQRIGFLIGRYEPHTDVPLGIRATVTAIYEPPQHCAANRIQLHEDPLKDTVDRLAAFLDLRRVGWVFTDLMHEEGGKVSHNRHVDTFFLSAQECITSGYFQNAYPNSCLSTSEGYCGSKFATVVVTGDKNRDVHFEGYQVSNQCAALVKDDCLVPVKQQPQLAFVKESSEEQYVPEVMYMEKDEYGNDVTRSAGPLPVEYLIVDVPASMPKEPEFTFSADPSQQYFPVANRMELVLQNIQALETYCSQFAKNQFFEMINDFHVLLYLLTNELEPFTFDELTPLCESLKSKDRVGAMTWAENSVKWNNLLHIMQGAAVMDTQAGFHENHNNRSPAPAGWHCSHCTFTNSVGRTDCEMCGLPRE